MVLPACSSEPNPQVVMETSMGTVKIELFQYKAPITVKNFLSYVDDKFYDGTIFHRVPRDGKGEIFVIQGGGVDQELREKETKAPVKNEAANGLSNARGTISMARTMDPNSATSQFFINVKDNKFLDRQDQDNAGYCVFGKVIDGMDVVDIIVNSPTTTKQGMQNVPIDPVLIKSAKRID